MGSKKRIKAQLHKPRKIKHKIPIKSTPIGPKMNTPFYEMHKLLKSLQIKNNLNIKLLLNFFNSYSAFSAWSRLGKTLKGTISYFPLSKNEKLKYSEKYMFLRKTKKIQKQNVRFKRLFFILFLTATLKQVLKTQLQILFFLTANVQQYFLNSLGINFFFFKTYSSGRCLRGEFGTQVSKGLKKSFKLNKALVEYYYFTALKSLPNAQHTHTMLKPFNRRTLILFSQIQNNSEYYFTELGFHKYYKINFKRVSRIKKRIKKKLISENFLMSPLNM